MAWPLRVRGLQPLKAEQYQSPDDQARVAADAADQAVADAVDDGWDSLSDQLDIAAIMAALSVGDYLAIKAMITSAMLTDAMRPVLARLVELQNGVAAAEMEAIDAGVGAAAGTAGAGVAGVAGDIAADVAVSSPAATPSAAIPLTFDAIEPSFVAQQQQAQSAFIQRLADGIEAVIDQDIRQGLTNGMSVDQVARTIKQTIGLTDRQAAAVENFRRLLTEGDPAALQRALRDRRFDASVQRLINGEMLDQDKIDRMVARYAERYQAHRAATIARTETARAANAGRRAAWSQYQSRKGLPNDGIRRFWLTAFDEAVCPVCATIPLMNPDGVAMDEDYASLNGPVTMPPDPHPLCRCTELFRVFPRAMQRAA